MRQHISKAWRILGGAIGFALFGLAGLLIGVGIVPFVHLLTPTRELAELRVQKVIQLTFRGLIHYLTAIGLGRVSWEGVERLRRPGVLVVANHPTLLDAVAVIARMPQCHCVMKQANFRNVFMRGAARAAGYLGNSDGTVLVDECTKVLREGRSLLLFPEGTRSTSNKMGPFHRGWAHIALRSGCDPIPVMISCDPPALKKGQKWYDIPDRPFHLKVRVDEPLVVRDIVSGQESRGRAARALNASLREHFEKELACAGDI